MYRSGMVLRASTSQGPASEPPMQCATKPSAMEASPLHCWAVLATCACIASNVMSVRARKLMRTTVSALLQQRISGLETLDPSFSTLA